MKRVMREEALNEEVIQELNNRNARADRLTEKWDRKTGLVEYMGGMKLADLDDNKRRNTAIILENQERHLRQLSETMISNAFTGVTPQNVIRIIRIGYPNSVRGEIFHEFAMTTTKDSFFYLKPTYSSAKRGSTKGNVMYEDSAYRYASEIEEESLGTGDGSTVTFTMNPANSPLRPYSIQIINGGTVVAVDTGSGTITGDGGDGTIDSYTTASPTVSFTFDTAPTSGNALLVRYQYDSEDSDQYADLGEVNLTLTDYQFRARPFPLGVSWSVTSEFSLGSTLDIDAQEQLVMSASEELKKSLDFQAVKYARRNVPSANAVTFDADWKTAGATSPNDYIQKFKYTIDQAGDKIYNALQRGGVSKMVAGPGACTLLKRMYGFEADNSQAKIGIFKEGSIDGIDLYRAPSDIIGNAEVFTIYKNEQNPTDVALGLGTFVPMYATTALEFKEMYKEIGLAHFGDQRVITKNYFATITINNISSY